MVDRNHDRSNAVYLPCDPECDHCEEEKERSKVASSQLEEKITDHTRSSGIWRQEVGVACFLFLHYNNPG